MIIVQKPKKKAKKQRKRTCYSCVNHSRFDSDFQNELPAGYVRCRYWGFVMTCGHAKICQHFEPYAPSSQKKGGRKKMRRW